MAGTASVFSVLSVRINIPSSADILYQKGYPLHLKHNVVNTADSITPLLEGFTGITGFSF